jgi:hypothetical protein
MSAPTAYEQYLLELINADRAKAGVQPLADNSQLNAAAGGHSQWMIDTDVFSHTGANGSQPMDRMLAAGYKFTGAWSAGENIGMTSVHAPSGYTDEVQQLHTMLMNSPGHRANILSANYTEAGLGLRVGDYQGSQAAFVTEDFAKSGSQHYLTGVAYADGNKDHFYEPGEGLGGVTVTAVSASGAKYVMQTYDSGGYDMALPTGSYTVTFSGAHVATSTQHVDIGANNVKLDLIDPAAAGTHPASTTPAPTPTPEPAPAPAPAPTTVADLASLLHGTASSDLLSHLSGFNPTSGNFVFV